MLYQLPVYFMDRDFSLENIPVLSQSSFLWTLHLKASYAIVSSIFGSLENGMFSENPVYVDKYNTEMCSTAVIGIHLARVRTFVEQTEIITKDIQKKPKFIQKVSKNL